MQPNVWFAAFLYFCCVVFVELCFLTLHLTFSPNAADLLSFDECLLWFCVFLRYAVFIYLMLLYKETCSECLQPRGHKPNNCKCHTRKLAASEHSGHAGVCVQFTWGEWSVFNLQGGAWQNKFVWSILELSLAHNMRVIRWKYYVKAHLVLCGIIQHQCCVVRGEWVDQNT